MTVSITENVLYRNDFIPLEIYIVVLIATFVFVLLSILRSYKREGIILSAFTLILGAFGLFSAFYLRVSDEFLTISNTEVLNVQTVFLSQGLLYLHMAIVAFGIILLWLNVANYTKNTLKNAENKNKDIKSNDGVA